MINKQSDITVPVGQDLQRLALLFANLRSVEIKKIMRQISVISLRLNCQCTINFFVMIPNNIKEMNSNPMEKLAFQDSISLISYMDHHAEDILKSSKSLLNQILTTTKEGLSTSWNDIKKTTSGNVEYDLWQMEKQVPESEIITEKAKSGQLRSIKISCFSVDCSKPL